MKTRIKTKVSIALVLLSLLVLPILEGCKKYPEGSSMSLRSRKERVANTWRVENYKINNSDFTSFVSGYTETYTKGGDYSYAWGNQNGSGKWEFQDNDEKIKINGTDNQSSHTLIILKLEERTFWYYYMDGNDKHEFHLIEK